MCVYDVAEIVVVEALVVRMLTATLVQTRTEQLAMREPVIETGRSRQTGRGRGTGPAIVGETVGIRTAPAGRAIAIGRPIVRVTENGRHSEGIVAAAQTKTSGLEVLANRTKTVTRLVNRTGSRVDGARSPAIELAKTAR